MILPAVVEERDAAVYSFANESLGSRLIRGIAQMMSAETKGGNFYCRVFTKRT